VNDIELLRQVPLFSALSEAELVALREIMAPVRFEPDAVIIREGEVGDKFYVVTEGSVQFLCEDAEGAELLLDEAGPAGFFGELSMLTGEPRAARVRAVEHVTVLALERDEFLEFLKQHPETAIEVVKVLGRRLHRVDELLRGSVSRNANEVEEDRLTFGARIADRFASVMGSWRFIIIQSCLLVTWVTLNAIAWVYRWDPYPFILLNLALSFQAAYSAPIIMMSQNRAAEKDRLAAEIDHQVNLHADFKIASVMRRLEELEKDVYRNHQEQVALLKELRTRGAG